MSRWKEKASRLGRFLPMDRLRREVRDRLESTDGAESLVLACSGGSDSICLVLLIYAHFPDRRKTMRVAHFNHGLRGLNSDEDERFAEGLASALDLEFSSEKWNRKETGSLSMEIAREARFEFFRRVQRVCESRLLLLGHQLDDVAEMLLMRIARGSGTGGMAAPRPVHEFREGFVHLRPLLDLSRSEIVDALTEVGSEWREDPSNQLEKYTRNRLRREVIPALKRASPQDAVRGAGRARDILEEDDDALNWWLDSLIGPANKGKSIDLSPLQDKPKALYRRAVDRFLWSNGVGAVPSRKCGDRLVEASIKQESLRVELSRKTFIGVKQCRLFMEETESDPKWTKLRVRAPVVVYFPCGSFLCVYAGTLGKSKRAEVRNGRCCEKKEAYLHMNRKETPDLTLRRWQPGDRYRPLGAPGRMKLQDLFTNRKISRAERKLLPVVSLGDGEIIWCPGIPPSDAHKIRPDSEFALRLTYCSSPYTL